uniref:ParB/RepB/Spo0J family partition protein n=1 Tax=Pseudonocardia dioxanivorans TaxID=240495 RepID=UPI000CD004FA|nr:ParB/RepB/Spo0J family partition protein [Pseudonocardia dioxanivorans]
MTDVVAKKDFAAMEQRAAARAGTAVQAREAMRSRAARPTALRLSEVQPNPQNPRYPDDDPEVVELANSMKQVGQLQPALVISRSDFVTLYPDCEAQLGPAPWVVYVGNRRLAAALLAGLDTFDVRVESEVQSLDDLEDRVLIENIHRKDLPPLLEAAHLQRRLNRAGQTLRSVAEAIGKSHTYVSQRVALLQLIPEFQDQLRAGTLSIKDARRLGGMPADEQRSVLAAGPPFVEQRPVAPAAQVGESSETRLSTAAVGEEGPLHLVPPLVNPVSNDSEIGGDGPPLASVDTAVAAAEAATSPREAAGATDPGPRRRAAASAVIQHLDNALAEADRVLSDGGDGDLARAFADAMRHMQKAQNRLRQHLTG